MSTGNIIKLAFAAVFAILSASCNRGEDVDTKSTIIVNITYDGSSANPSFVALYDFAETKNFDKSYDSACKFGDYRKLYDADGNELSPVRVSDDVSGVNTFEDVKRGKYIAVAVYKPSGFSFPNYYFYGYVVFDADNELVSKTLSFKHDSERAVFIQF